MTTGIKYNPVVTFTVPIILQALFQAEKQNAEAATPRNKKLNQLTGFENLIRFVDKEKSVKKSSRLTVKIFEDASSGNIKISAKKKTRRVEQTGS